MIHSLPLSVVLLVVLFGLLIFLVEIRVLTYAYRKIGVNPRYAFAVMLLSLLGSGLNIPLVPIGPSGFTARAGQGTLIMSAFRDPSGVPLPGLAPVAIQQGRRAADNALRRLSGQPTLAFRYHDRGTMATIGRAAAVAVIGGVQLSGLIAWLAWLFVHIMFLIGFRNRLLVIFEWAWAYVSWQRGARLITRTWRSHNSS